MISKPSQGIQKRLSLDISKREKKMVRYIVLRIYDYDCVHTQQIKSWVEEYQCFPIAHHFGDGRDHDGQVTADVVHDEEKDGDDEGTSGLWYQLNEDCEQNTEPHLGEQVGCQQRQKAPWRWKKKNSESERASHQLTCGQDPCYYKQFQKISAFLGIDRKSLEYLWLEVQVV